MLPIRIVTWNCSGALRRKRHALDRLHADILVVQECEDPKQAKDLAYLEWAGRYLWVGDNKNKGIGVFVRTDASLEYVNLDLNPIRLFLPCLLNGAPLLATWTQHANSPTFKYIGQLWKFLQSHKTFLDHPKALLIGDLNSNVQWDKWDRWWNHSDVIEELEDLGIRSAYHHYKGISQGNEPDATFYLHKNLEKPYHIDYAFIGPEWELLSLNLGGPADWLIHSDHMPLLLTLKTHSAPSEPSEGIKFPANMKA